MRIFLVWNNKLFVCLVVEQWIIIMKRWEPNFNENVGSLYGVYYRKIFNMYWSKGPVLCCHL